MDIIKDGYYLEWILALLDAIQNEYFSSLVRFILKLPGVAVLSVGRRKQWRSSKVVLAVNCERHSYYILLS